MNRSWLSDSEKSVELLSDKQILLFHVPIFYHSWRLPLIITLPEIIGPGVLLISFFDLH
jgi:hypothetical protein